MVQQLTLGDESQAESTEADDVSAYNCPTMGCDGSLRHQSMAEPAYHCSRCDHEFLTQTVEVYNND